MTTMTLRLSDEEKALISDYAKTFGMTVSEFVRSSTLDRIEDELDLKVWREAKAEADADSTRHTATDMASKYL